MLWLIFHLEYDGYFMISYFMIIIQSLLYFNILYIVFLIPYKKQRTILFIISLLFSTLDNF